MHARFPKMFLVLSVVAVAIAAERAHGADHAQKIVGSWNFAKATTSDGSPGGGVKGTVYEFTGDGKVKLTIHLTNRVVDGGTGTYQITGDTLNMKLPFSDAVTTTIKSLTDTNLVFESKRGEVTVTEEFKRQ